MMLGGPIIAGATLSPIFCAARVRHPGTLIGLVGLHSFDGLKPELMNGQCPDALVKRLAMQMSTTN